MDDQERAVTETLQRVNLFGIENAAAVAGVPKAVNCFAAIQAAIDELESRGILRGSASGAKFSATEIRAIKRHTFSQLITKISGTARDIARNDETFVNKFKRPSAERNDLIWLETGRAFAADLPAVADKFAEYGYKATIGTDLTTAADDFEAAINAQNAYLRQRIDSNASIDSIISDALKALRTLKVIVPNIFSGNPGKLADWASASHIEKKTRKPEPQPTPNN
jgi:hypothetical protein